MYQAKSLLREREKIVGKERGQKIGVSGVDRG